MANYNSNNPMLRKSVFSKASKTSYSGSAMTRGGTIGKTVVLFALLIAGGAIAWLSNFTFLQHAYGMAALLIAGTALSFITAFVPKASPFTAPVYALIEGMLLGVITAAFGAAYNGIVFQSILITVGIFIMTLIFYSTHIITVTNRLRSIILIATTGIMFVYLADIVMSLFGASVTFLNNNGIVGIAINLLVVLIASLNFLIDFDYFDRACAMGAPKYMEWYMGYSIMVTFVWLYLEVLRLLSKISSRS